MTHVRRPNRRPMSDDVSRLLQGETCGATGKVRYPDQHSAGLVMRQQAARDPRGDALEIYRCRGGCPDWHIGHGAS